MGIFRAIVTGFANAYGANQAYVRALNKGVAGRGEDLPAQRQTANDQSAGSLLINHVL